MVDETKYRVIGLEFRRLIATNMVFPRHLHKTYELLRVLRGSAWVAIDGREHVVHRGEDIFVFPFQHHSFRVDGDSKIEILVFSPGFVEDFAQETQNLVPEENLFTLHVPEALLDGVGSYNIYQLKALFYAVCGDFLKSSRLIPRPATKELTSAVDKALIYIDEHFSESCSLRDVADALRYDYYYLSKKFKDKMGMPFTEYLSQFRINKACYALASTDKTILEVSGDAGFDSVRTFNRKFYKTVGTTPSEYRRGAHQEYHSTD